MLSCSFMLGMAPGAKEVVVPTANMSHLKETPGKAVANGAVAIDEAAGVAEETVTTGKDSSGLSCYAYRIYAFAYIRTKAAYLSLNPYLLSGCIVNPSRQCATSRRRETSSLTSAT